MTLDHFVFIINNRSGTRRNEKLQMVLQEELKAYGIRYDIHITESADETNALVKKHLQLGHSYFIAVGGDGTVNTLAKNLVHTHGVMGIIPRGSGNGLARHLHLPKGIRTSLNRLVKKRIHIIDAITINREWAFNVAGLGFDGLISTLFGQNGKRGLSNYMKLIQSEYKNYQPIEIVYHYNNESVSKNIFQVAFANASQYGNNAIIAPNASLNDQLIDICLIDKVPMALLPAFFLKVFSGNIGQSNYAQSFTSDHLEVETSRPVHFHTDGDGRGIAQKFEIKLIPSCLKLMY
ncbi:MAG: diacylglycerol kinase family protein [Saprospiraceae bacterium]